MRKLRTAVSRNGLTRAVAHGLGISRKEASTRVDDCLRFLQMCSRSRYPLTPTRQIDEVWHIFLNMNSYEPDCRRLFGRTIQHVPSEAGQDKKLRVARVRSRRMAQLLFGTAFAQGWREKGQAPCCSNCSHVLPRLA